MQQKIQLLIIDDDLIFNQLVHAFISSQGVSVESVFSVAEARQYLQTHQPDFIILDYMLKDGMGIELMEDIGALGLTMPVMMVTADDDQETMRECFERGIDDYLLKPLNFELLWLKIQRLSAVYQLKIRAAQQARTVQALLDEKDNEEALARYVYEHMVDQDFKSDGFVQSLLKSSSTFNGDTLLVAKAPTGNICIILMDATGHGLAAAISILPLATTFTGLVEKGFELSRIVYELNQKLTNSIPDDRFVAAIVIEIDRDNACLNVWNGGMPDILMLNDNGDLSGEVVSQNMPLGILDSADFDPNVQSYDVSEGGHLVFCSDGLLEQQNCNKQYFGMLRLKEILAANRPEQFIEKVDAEFSRFVEGQLQTDDVSICHVDINKFFSLKNIMHSHAKNQNGQVHLNLNVNGKQLGSFDVMQCLDVFMTQTHMPFELRQKSFTVCAELVVNALEHGVLDLKSSIKDEENGFVKFLEERETRVGELSISDNVNMAISYDSQKSEVSFRVSDSGLGYDQNDVMERAQSDLSGRGISLIERLSSQTHYEKDKNQTSVIIK